MSTKPAISFIGLGAMGFGMATHLIKRGYSVTGFDAWPPTLDKFKAEGGKVASNPAEAVKGADFCVCMVANAAQAQAVLMDGDDAAVTAFPKGTTVLLCSTVPPSYVQSLEKQLATHGDVLLVDAPVSGGAQRAAEGTLSIMAGGSDVAIEKSRFLLQELSDKLYIIAGGVGAGSNMKMVHQVLAAIQVLSASEAMGFARYLGLDLQKTAENILKSEGRSWMFGNRSPRMLHPEFKPVASAMAIMLKDVGIITSEARHYGVPVPMSEIAKQVYMSGLQKGYGQDDDSSMIRVYTEGLGASQTVTNTGCEERLALVVALLKGIHLCSTAEALNFAARLGLDLDQVLELCKSAAGGSYMLDVTASHILRRLKVDDSQPILDPENMSLEPLAKELQDAVSEAKRLKAPTYLGDQALSSMRLALSQRPKPTSMATLGDIIAVYKPLI